MIILKFLIPYKYLLYLATYFLFTNFYGIQLINQIALSVLVSEIIIVFLYLFFF